MSELFNIADFENLIRKEGAILSQLLSGSQAKSSTRSFNEFSTGANYSLVVNRDAEQQARDDRELQTLKDRAIALGTIVTSSSNRDEIDAAISELKALAASARGGNGQAISSIVATYIASGYKHLNQVEREEATHSVMAEEIAHRTPISEEHDSLAHKLKEKGYFTDEELKKFEAIDPKAKYKVVVFDDEGKIVRNEDGSAKTEEISGQRKRDNISIYKGAIASGDRRKTHEERLAAQRDLDEFLEEHSGIDGDDTHEERQHKKRRRTEEAVREVAGEEVHMLLHEPDGTPKEVNAAIEQQVAQREESLRNCLVSKKQISAKEDAVSATVQKVENMAPANEEAARMLESEELFAKQELEASYIAFAEELAGVSSEWGDPGLADGMSFDDISLMLDEDAPALPAEVNRKAIEGSVRSSVAAR